MPAWVDCLPGYCWVCVLAWNNCCRLYIVLWSMGFCLLTTPCQQPGFSGFCLPYAAAVFWVLLPPACLLYSYLYIYGFHCYTIWISATGSLGLGAWVSGCSGFWNSTSGFSAVPYEQRICLVLLVCCHAACLPQQRTSALRAILIYMYITSNLLIA